ncbi:benzoate transporter [Idiomarina xiamenensis 10-D-4]|uniref:Benzoate transporter n=1 Tax=Idiomarina xiamenensis 10-D-4 TaxID=740709 RepID=K2LB72_9GAMM|nr:benzoate/H(+) symporter BenE family transporter [Idiomarina xiamenensis]EKE87055.1 benzoate transporter [Idiomarina xiamenensis 10-D-4]
MSNLKSTAQAESQASLRARFLALWPNRGSHWLAGFMAVLVGYSSAAAIIIQAAQAAGASAAEINSWFWVLGVGMGLSTILLSWRYRMPILTAWSTPGAALLVVSLDGVSSAQAVAIFLVSSALITLAGVSGAFRWLVKHIPVAISAGLLAGILLQFGLKAAAYFQHSQVLFLLMLGAYLLLQRVRPKLAVLAAMLLGLGYCIMQQQLQWPAVAWQWAMPVWLTPSFEPHLLLGVALPLALVTLVSQNVPGFAVLAAHGYQPPQSALVTSTGIVGLLSAPFGGFAFNLAAITAAICMQDEAEADPRQRYRVCVAAGLAYLLMGLLAAAMVTLLLALPASYITILAGLALLPTLANSMAAALQTEATRTAALLTLLVTASGVQLWSLNSAFWGLLVGLVSARLIHR